MTIGNKNLLQEITLVAGKEILLVERNLNQQIRVDAEALLRRFVEQRTEIATAIAEGNLASPKGGFCPLVIRHMHKPGGTHALIWGRLINVGGKFRTCRVQKHARGSDYALATLHEKVPAAFWSLVESTERSAAELRQANRLLVTLRKSARQFCPSSTPREGCG